MAFCFFVRLQVGDRDTHRRLHVILSQRTHILGPRFHQVVARQVAVDYVRYEDVAERRVLPTRYEQREVLLCGGKQPGIFWVNLETGGPKTLGNQSIEILVREVALTLTIGLFPELQYMPLDDTKGLALGNAGVAVEAGQL